MSSILFILGKASEEARGIIVVGERIKIINEQMIKEWWQNHRKSYDL